MNEWHLTYYIVWRALFSFEFVCHRSRYLWSWILLSVLKTKPKRIEYNKTMGTAVCYIVKKKHFQILLLRILLLVMYDLILTFHIVLPEGACADKDLGYRHLNSTTNHTIIIPIICIVINLTYNLYECIRIRIYI